MADDTGMSALEFKINQFESLIAEMKEVTREAHSTLKQMQHERAEIEKLLKKRAQELVDERIEKIVMDELEKMGPWLKEFSSGIYDRVGQQVDKMIDLAMGKEFATTHHREDLRPQLAKKLRVWIREVIEAEALPGGT